MDKALEIFRNLNPNNGFMGINLEDPFVLQIIPKKKGVKIELLDSSIPAMDFCEGADSTLAEQLIVAAGKGEDVFQLARQKVSAWKHLKMA